MGDSPRLSPRSLARNKPVKFIKVYSTKKNKGIRYSIIINGTQTILGKVLWKTLDRGKHVISFYGTEEGDPYRIEYDPHNAGKLTVYEGVGNSGIDHFNIDDKFFIIKETSPVTPKTPPTPRPRPSIPGGKSMRRQTLKKGSRKKKQTRSL
jgi:hypothetical protein